jgi:hypothetical protein
VHVRLQMDEGDGSSREGLHEDEDDAVVSYMLGKIQGRS